jgi:hypothetical protein
MADASIASSTARDGLVLIEPACPLKDSLLWELQERFYTSLNIKAWSDAIVPNFVTSNAFIAHCYARVLLDFLKDWFARPDADPTEPVHVVEIGAGHGRLAFLVLRELLSMREQWPAMAEPAAAPFKWIITDFTDGNLAFWLGHECLKPFFDAGLCDAAIFDAERDTELHLRVSDRRVADGSLRNPTVAICNYIFDTLRQDAFRVVEGQLQVALAGLFSDRAETDPSHPDVIKRMRVAWDYRPVTPEEAYPDDPALQTMLRVYVSRMPNASILVPIGGIRAMSRVGGLSRGQRVFALCGDKAYNHEEELIGLRDPHVAVHGSFSFMVNFHAVRLYTLARGGFSLHSPQLDGFKVSGFVVGCGSGAPPSLAVPLSAASVPAGPAALSSELVASLSEVTVSGAALAFPALLCAWADVMDTFGPDNFSTLQRCVRDELPSPSLKTALCAVRLSHWDSDVFFKFKQVVIEKAPSVSEKQQADIYSDLVRVAERYYPLQTSKDIAFELGRICMGLKRYADAISLFNDSRRQCGEHHVTSYNIAICRWYRSEFRAALESFDSSLAMRPDYTDALNWRTRVQAKLQGEEFLRAQALPEVGLQVQVAGELTTAAQV